MNSALVKTCGFLKTAVLTLLFISLFFALLQLDIPNLQGLWHKISSSWLERQFEFNNDNEDLIKQGWVYYNLGRYDRAQNLMENALQKEHNISALYCLGLIDVKYRRFDEGISKLQQVISFSPNHTPTLMALGRIYFESNYFGKSRNYFERAVEAEPTSTEARLWLGRTYLKLSETDKAIEILSTITSGHEAAQAAALIKDH